MVDTYYASRPRLSGANEVSNSNVTNPKGWKQFKHFNASDSAPITSSSEAAGKVVSGQSQTTPASGGVKEVQPRRCWTCNSPTHVSKNCPQKARPGVPPGGHRNSTTNAARSQACTVRLDPVVMVTNSSSVTNETINTPAMQ